MSALALRDAGGYARGIVAGGDGAALTGVALTGVAVGTEAAAGVRMPLGELPHAATTAASSTSTATPLPSDEALRRDVRIDGIDHCQLGRGLDAVPFRS